jgi:hypothetical protein
MLPLQFLWHSTQRIGINSEPSLFHRSTPFSRSLVTQGEYYGLRNRWRQTQYLEPAAMSGLVSCSHARAGVLI